MGRGLGGGLGLAVAVCSAHLDGVIAWGGVPIVDVLAPGIFGELFREAGRIPGLSAVGRDLDLLDTAVGGPGDTAYGVMARGEVLAGADGIDARLGLDGAFLRPGALDPVGVEVPIRELYLGEPLGSRDVPVEAGDDEASGVAVLYGELAAVQAEGDQGVAAVEGDVRLEARREAVHAAAHELPGGAGDLVPAHTGFRKDVGEQHPGPASVGDEPAAYGVGDARERYVRLAGGHAEKILVGKLDGVLYRPLDRELPAVRVYPRRSERGVYKVEGAGRRDELRHTRHVYGGIRRRWRQRLVGDRFALLRFLLLARWRFGQVQLLGPGSTLHGSTTEQASHARGREAGHDCAAAEQQEAAPPDGHTLVGAGLPRPHDGRGSGARLTRRDRLLRGLDRSAEACRAQQEFADRSAGEEGTDDGDHGGGCGHERIGQCRGYGDGREAGDPGEGQERAPDGEVAEEEGYRYRADEHHHDKRRYIRLAEELDALGH